MRSKDMDKLMYNLGRVKEYQPDHGFGFVTVQDNNETIFFEISDFPSEGGLPRKGENVKFIIVQNQGKLKASQFIRLDHAPKYSFKMPSLKVQSWHDPVQQNRSKATKVFVIKLFTSVLLSKFTESANNILANSVEIAA